MNHSHWKMRIFLAPMGKFKCLGVSKVSPFLYPFFFDTSFIHLRNEIVNRTRFAGLFYCHIWKFLAYMCSPFLTR